MPRKISIMDTKLKLGKIGETCNKQTSKTSKTYKFKGSKTSKACQQRHKTD
jgi:hypothetical protein